MFPEELLTSVTSRVRELACPDQGGPRLESVEVEQVIGLYLELPVLPECIPTNVLQGLTALIKLELKLVDERTVLSKGRVVTGSLGNKNNLG